MCYHSVGKVKLNFLPNLCQSSYKTVLGKVLEVRILNHVLSLKEGRKCDYFSLVRLLSFFRISVCFPACLPASHPYQPLYKILCHSLSVCSLSMSLAFLINTFPFFFYEYLKTPNSLKHAVVVSYFTPL